MEDELYADPYSIHILLEVFCSYNWQDEDTIEPVPAFCKRDVSHPGYHCLFNKCRYASYTHAENELSFTGEYGEVPNEESFIAIEDLSDQYDEPQITELKKEWRDICSRKISEATLELEDLLKKRGIQCR
jgi:hypothetical protein